MKHSTVAFNQIRKDHLAHAIPRLVAECNWNRYGSPTADNTPSEYLASDNPDLYPIESITDANRPARGNMKARIGEMVIASSYNPLPPDVRFHLASADDPYKYWTSPVQSGTSPIVSGGITSYDFPAGVGMPTDVNPHVIYSDHVKANKIVVGLENSLHSPVHYDIYVMVGSAWTPVADETTSTIDDNGRIILYWNGADWSGTEQTNELTKIKGVQLRVQSMDSPSVHFNLIELAALLEWDVSDYLIEFSDQFDLGDSNILAPIGRISSNNAGFSLFNALVDETDHTKGLMFNAQNPESPFYGLTNENVRFTLDYIYKDVTGQSEASEAIRGFTMYADRNWSADLKESVSVSVKDFSKYLQETKAPDTLYYNVDTLTIGEVIWKMLDAVGFSDYHIDIDDVSAPLPMEYFWARDDKYVWDVLNELSNITQTAIYFDSYGILQIKTKEKAFDTTAAPVWTVRSDSTESELADIVQDGLVVERKDISNSIKISYKKLDFQRTALDNIISQEVWKPEGTVIVRSSDITKDCLAGDMTINIVAKEATDWPYSGMLQIEGEIMKYDGKEFTYVDDTAGGVTKTAIVKNLEEYQMLHWKTNANNQYKNVFTGKLILTERGMWNTNIVDHKTGTYNYTITQTKGSAVYPSLYSYYYKKKKVKPADQTNTSTGLKHEPSFLRLETPSTHESTQYLYATAGSTDGDSPTFFGTKIRFPKRSTKFGRGGIVINSVGNIHMGYHIEIIPTEKTSKSIYEIAVNAKKSDGNFKRVNGKGWRFNIVEDTWYSIDVQLSRGEGTGLGNSTHTLWVWINGTLAGTAKITGSLRQNNSGRFGMYVRGETAMEYEYLYAYSRRDDGTQFWGDDVSYYDRIYGGYTTNQYLNNFMTKTRLATRRVKKKNETFTQ